MNKYQTYAKINLDNLIHNYKKLKEEADGRLVIPVIKADAYGHGAEIIAHALEREGAKLFAVSSIYEAMCLRDDGISEDILILGYVPENKISKIIDYDIIPAIYNMDFIKLLNEEAKKYSKVVRVHIALNTGMNRIGFRPDEEGIKNIEEINNLSNIHIEGMFSHFATSDEIDKTYSKEQFEKFDYVINELEKKGINIKIKHIANSAAITDLKEYHLDAVRAGIVLYGIYPSEVKEGIVNPYKPVMSLYTSITNIFDVKKGESIGYGRTYYAKEDEKIAVMCIGYADGYNRKLSNSGSVLINNKYKADVVGNVCMDMTMLRLNKNDDIHIGDSVEVFGENILIEELANKCSTITYELLCVINKRVKRVYVKDGK